MSGVKAKCAPMILKTHPQSPYQPQAGLIGNKITEQGFTASIVRDLAIHAPVGETKRLYDTLVGASPGDSLCPLQG